MYIPKINLTTNKAEILAFMKQFSFATIITAKDGFPIATHLPFIISVKEDKVVLTSHFAKANEHWQYIENNKVLVIFSEPHAYISTKNYDKELNVPTWNYVSVHAYGEGKLVSETHRVFEVLEATIDNYETSYRKHWDNFPQEYKLKMAKGIVAFEIVVTDLQAKKKLSQNRSDTEKEKIIVTLSNSKDTNEQLIAKYMTAEGTSAFLNSLHSDLKVVNKLVYNKCGFHLTNFKQNAESQEYAACSFVINGKKIHQRISKITPTKTGQFVAIWKRNNNGITVPFDISDNFDFVIITARSNHKLGQFIFPKSALAFNRVISQNGKGGKRGIRVYPPWDNVTNEQAEQTQRWQTKYFLTIKNDDSTDLNLAKKLLEAIS